MKLFHRSLEPHRTSLGCQLLFQNTPPPPSEKLESWRVVHGKGTQLAKQSRSTCSHSRGLHSLLFRRGKPVGTSLQRGENSGREPACTVPGLRLSQCVRGGAVPCSACLTPATGFSRCPGSALPLTEHAHEPESLPQVDNLNVGVRSACVKKTQECHSTLRHD